MGSACSVLLCVYFPCSSCFQLWKANKFHLFFHSKNIEFADKHSLQGITVMAASDLCFQVRDRATLYINTLGGDGAVVETGKDVKDFLFGSLDVPLVNLETSLKNYVSYSNLLELLCHFKAVISCSYHFFFFFFNFVTGAFRRAL